MTKIEKAIYVASAVIMLASCFYMLICSIIILAKVEGRISAAKDVYSRPSPFSSLRK